MFLSNMTDVAVSKILNEVKCFYSGEKTFGGLMERVPFEERLKREEEINLNSKKSLETLKKYSVDTVNELNKLTDEIKCVVNKTCVDLTVNKSKIKKHRKVKSKEEKFNDYLNSINEEDIF